MSIDVKKWPSHGIQELMSLCLKMYSRKRIKITIARSRKAMPMTIQGQVLHTYHISQYQHSSNEWIFGFFCKSVSFYSDYFDYECSIFFWKSKVIEVWMHSLGLFSKQWWCEWIQNKYKLLAWTNTSCQLDTLWANQWSHVTKNWNDVRIIVWPSLTFIH